MNMERTGVSVVAIGFVTGGIALGQSASTGPTLDPSAAAKKAGSPPPASTKTRDLIIAAAAK
jgi:hypothetical protein